MRAPYQLLALGVLAALAALLAAAQAPTPKPKVVLVFLDGAANGIVSDYLTRGVLPADGALAEMARTGARAEYMVPPDASLTAPAHYTMLTGTYPDRHGIVSNIFHPWGAPIQRSVRGFDAPVYVETLWEAARRQGKRVISIAAMADGTAPERSADLTLAFGRRLGTALVTKLAPAAEGDSSRNAPWNFGGEKLERARELFPVGEGSHLPTYQLESGPPLTLMALAADTQLDDREAFDTLYLDFDRDLGNGFTARLRAGQWAPVVLRRPSPQMGSWFKVLELAPDLSRVRLYMSAGHQNRGAPPEYIEAIERELGFWPGEPDNAALNDGLIDEQTWMEQAERLSDYLRDVTLFSMRHYDYDLLITYTPLLDEVGEQFLLVDPQQPGYEDEGGARRARYAGHLERAYRLADAQLKLLRAAAPGARFVVASDHGMQPVHTRVRINVLLQQAGFKVAPDETAEVRAFSSGTTAHIYLNLAGREPNGVVSKKDRSKFTRRIVAACRDLRDPSRGGARVFEQVMTREELYLHRLGHPLTAGDVWVNARLGYALSSQMEGPLFEAATMLRGMHGYPGSLRRMDAIFFAAGPGIPAAPLPGMHSVDVAATVSALLGIEPPKRNEGRNVLPPAR
ncbi:MAG TPA: alkaline phosphatase family protein [Candidatus Xenobia bacterium]|nr:alkaline phosphatase family protein [Candidatus Xenobia bacterium]